MSNITVERDGSGKSYVEIDLEHGERLRVTLVDDSWFQDRGVRIQLRSKDGHLRQGPEIPASTIGDVVAAVVELVRQPRDGGR